MGNAKILSLRNIIGFIIVVAVILLAIQSIDIILMLFGSFVITCAIIPIINKLEKYMPRIWAVTLLLLGLILASFLILVPLITVCVKEAANLVDSFPAILSNIDKLLDIKIFNHSLSSFITLDSLKEAIIHSSDVFYHTGSFSWQKLRDEKGCKAVEMESYALFVNAMFLGKNATALLMVSDSFLFADELSSLEREQGLDNMIALALESCLKM